MPITTLTSKVYSRQNLFCNTLLVKEQLSIYRLDQSQKLIKNFSKKFQSYFKHIFLFSKWLKTNIKDGSKVKTEIIANNIANPVKIPKQIVGMNLDKTKIEKPKTIVIEVFQDCNTNC